MISRDPLISGQTHHVLSHVHLRDLDLTISVSIYFLPCSLYMNSLYKYFTKKIGNSIQVGFLSRKRGKPNQFIRLIRTQIIKSSDSIFVWVIVSLD